MTEKRVWHNLSIKEVLVRLKAGEKWLSEEEERQKGIPKFFIDGHYDFLYYNYSADYRY